MIQKKRPCNKQSKAKELYTGIEEQNNEPQEPVLLRSRASNAKDLDAWSKVKSTTL